MKRFSRPLCLLLSFLIFSSFLVVPSFAAENLVNPNLNEWENVITSGYNSVEGTLEMNCTTVPAGGYITYYLQPTFLGNSGSDGSVPVYYGYSLDKTILKTGTSYTFSMHVLSPSEIRARTSFNWDDNGFVSRLGSGYVIGFGVVSDTGELTFVTEFITITKDNFLSLAGTDFVYSFECPDYSGGNPCIFIAASSTYSVSTMFFDNSMTLVDNDQEEEDDFFGRLFEWFEEKFNNLKSWFTSLGNEIGSSLTNLGDRISSFFDSLGELFTDSINGLLDGIGGWFQKLGNLILYFTWSDEVPENPFKADDGLLTIVRGFFDEFSSYLSNLGDTMNSVVDSITGPIYLLDRFTQRFDWLLGIVTFALLMIVVCRFIGL